MAFHLYYKQLIGLSLCVFLLAVVGCNQENTTLESSPSSSTKVEETTSTISSSDIPSDAFSITEDNGKYYLTGEYGTITADAYVCTTRDVYDPGTLDVIRAQMRVFDETDIAKEVQSTWTETSHTVTQGYAPMTYERQLYDHDSFTYSDPVLGSIEMNEIYYGIGYTTDSDLWMEIRSTITSGMYSGDLVPTCQNDSSDSRTLITDYYDKVGVSLPDNYLVYSSSINGSDFEYYRSFQTINDMPVANELTGDFVYFIGEKDLVGYSRIRTAIVGNAIVYTSVYGYFLQTSIITADVALCTLESALNTAVATLSSSGANSPSIYEVQLAYLPILDAEVDNDYYMLPCWVFTYHEGAMFSTDTNCAFIDATSGQWIETTNEGP